MIRLIFICLLIIPIVINGIRRRCINTGVLFPDKISRSSIVVYGESLAKKIYLETDTELLFNITFRVDCIFKGEDIGNRIEITEAGIQTNRTSCQWLDPGKVYVVFLEKSETTMTTYRPVDFQERIVDEMTYELLERTCHLTRIPPLNSIINTCPNVSMAEFCPDNQFDIKIMPKGKNFDYENTHVKSSLNNANQFYPQSNVTKPTDRSLAEKIADNPHNHADVSNFPFVSIIILVVNIAMFI